MSAQEFGEWQVFFKNEQEHPQAHRARHAVLLAALRNGPLSKNDGSMWTASDCLPSDQWEPAEVAPKVPSAPDLAHQVARLNALMD